MILFIFVKLKHQLMKAIITLFFVVVATYVSAQTTTHEINENVEFSANLNTCTYSDCQSVFPASSYEVTFDGTYEVEHTDFSGVFTGNKVFSSTSASGKCGNINITFLDCGEALIENNSFCGSRSFEVTINGSACQAVGVNEYVNISNIYLYSNPVENIVTIVGANPLTTQITIIDLSGKHILSNEKLTSNQFDVSMLPRGVYFMSVSNGTEQVTQKIVKL